MLLDPTTWTFTNSSIPPLDWNWTNNTNVQSQCITPIPTSLQDFNSTDLSQNDKRRNCIFSGGLFLVY